MRAIAAFAAAVAVAAASTGCGSDDTPSDPIAVDSPAATINFSTLDANGDSYLDVDEIPERADAGMFESWDADADSELDRDEIDGNVFMLWDADHNGRITNAEWKQATERWYPSKEVVVPLADWDGDGDSELDADEWAEKFDHTALGTAWKFDTLNKQQFKKAYFGLYDADNDGKVSEAEFRSGLAWLGTPAEA